jgi:hypothetical protein
LRLELLDGTGGPAPLWKQLHYSGHAWYPETGQYSREWHYYWNRYVAEKGQAGTVQGEVLRVTHRLAAMYSNSGGGNWMEDPDTYDAYADLVVAVLCDGMLEGSKTEFARKTVTELRRYCHDMDETSPRPDYSDVDRLTDLAVEWCRLHPRPIHREPDPRMAF